MKRFRLYQRPVTSIEDQALGEDNDLFKLYDNLTYLLGHNSAFSDMPIDVFEIIDHKYGNTIRFLQPLD